MTQWAPRLKWSSLPQPQHYCDSTAIKQGAALCKKGHPTLKKVPISVCELLYVPWGDVGDDSYLKAASTETLQQWSHNYSLCFTRFISNQFYKHINYQLYSLTHTNTHTHVVVLFQWTRLYLVYACIHEINEVIVNWSNIYVVSHPYVLKLHATVARFAVLRTVAPSHMVCTSAALGRRWSICKDRTPTHTLHMHTTMGTNIFHRTPCSSNRCSLYVNGCRKK